jgi:hypothetical protein
MSSMMKRTMAVKKMKMRATKLRKILMMTMMMTWTRMENMVKISHTMMKKIMSMKRAKNQKNSTLNTMKRIVTVSKILTKIPARIRILTMASLMINLI